MSTSMKQLKEAGSKLQDRHFQWMIDAALDHFQKEIERCELEIVRHEKFSGEVLYGYRTLDATRQESVDRARRGLDEYRSIVAFLRALSRVSLEFSAEKFAQEVASMFRNHRV